MSLLDQVDSSTKLAQRNEVQLLVFRVDVNEEKPFYAINVFKTREVVEAKRHKLTLIPGTNPYLEGTIVLRGMQIPILNLPLWLNINLDRESIKNSDFLICDFNGVQIGLRIMHAYRVIRKNWNEMHAPDNYSVNNESKVINHTHVETGELCLVLDYERLLAEVIPQAMVDPNEIPEDFSALPDKLKYGLILIAEDSKTAQKHLEMIFHNANIDHIIFPNGKLLVDYLAQMPDKERVAAIITDIEMPEMSGFTVIKLLKSSPETAQIPIIVNSSMTGDNNKREAESLGADGFVDKTKSKDIIPLIATILHANT